ncbi:MAG: formate dehydrogenase, partial [Gammaproteobacteria bacterium]|nr:formate dehydrogenase [Gammaproteobacteria bacterium]
MTARVYVPDETTACSLGADEVAACIEQQIDRHGIDAELIRNGSRGAFHLEPLVEVEAEGARSRQRVGFGPVSVESAPGLFDAGVLPTLDHPLSVGPVDQIPFLADQTRLTFARAGLFAPLDFESYRG